MCHALWQLVSTFVQTFVENWTYFVTQPWKQCTKQRKCYWACLCCNKWFCWVGLIIVAIIVVFVMINYLIFVVLTLIFCETLCVLRVYVLGEQRVGCFAYENPPPANGSSPPPPPPPMGTGSGTDNQPR